ncbi:MAG TPA: CrcB family protein [Bacillota bacterium]|nr:CrcB family protein [Bacillota bacterium]
MSIVFVAWGGFFGAIARYYISLKTNHHHLGTWMANITGSILLAIVIKLAITGQISEFVWHVFGVGFCGAYTTFSTFGHETIQLILDKQYKSAAIYLLSTLFISFGCIQFIIRYM